VIAMKAAGWDASGTTEGTAFSPNRTSMGGLTMLVIFGFSVSEDVLGVVRYVCETCGNEGAHRVLRHRRRFTLFFIPLFSVGTRYADVCTWCARTRELSQDQAEQATRQLR
jgi:hypothetical protein